MEPKLTIPMTELDPDYSQAVASATEILRLRLLTKEAAGNFFFKGKKLMCVTRIGKTMKELKVVASIEDIPEGEFIEPIRDHTNFQLLHDQGRKL